MQYRYSYYANGQLHAVMADGAELYPRQVRKQWQVIPGTRYQGKVMDVELNLAESPKDEPVWAPDIFLSICLGFFKEID